ncbi:MAG: hypothetical protein GY754_17400 [bacterium]|nr:hypothetical protein [bacterium]
MNKRYVLELKIWRGPVAHEKGLEQLAGYLHRLGLNKGYLLVFDFTQIKEAKEASETVMVRNKEIFMVRV